MKGIVYLIGAGPGDYKLITVKGRECIEQADVIVYDYLADEKILRWARPDAELIYAGKQANKHTMKQEEINNLLVQKGKEGHIVARLKGGDPLVFGRGGEEALALEAEGIPFEFVPGVTSAIAAPAYAGIPVTHRAVATSFAIVTGHEDPTKNESGMNWEHLAKSVDTICFVMGVGNLPHITAQLMKYGRPGTTPAAVIRWGTKPIQETLVTTLETAAEDVAKANLKPPAIFMVGEVVTLREKLRWFDIKPLFGKRIIVTRARSQASGLVHSLETLGADVLETPAIRTVGKTLTDEMKEILEHLERYHTLTFTSAQGVEFFFRALTTVYKDARSLAGKQLCAIGSATAKTLAKHGLLADLIPTDYRAESLVKALEGRITKNDRMLLIQPVIARSVIPDELGKAGVSTDILRLYETVQDSSGADVLRNALMDGIVDYITFTSSSTVTNTLALLGEDGAKLLANTNVVCIGPITAATCNEFNVKPDIISETFTTEAMVEAIQAHCNKEMTI